MRALSLFSGCGALDLAAERAGFDTVAQCEIEPKRRGVLARHWPRTERITDVATLDGTQFRGAIGLLHGGFPCQDLSVAGRRAGLAGERSGLFYHFARLIGEIAPQWVLIENVAGLLSSNGGRDMGIVLGTLGELGYWWAYRSLDARYFGLAQQRNRVFIVGCAGAGRAAEVLFEPESVQGHPAPRREAGEAPGTGAGAGAAGGGGETVVTAPDLAAPLGSLTGGHKQDLDNATYVVIQDAREIEGKRQNGLGVNYGGPMYTLDGVSQHAVYVPRVAHSMSRRDHKGVASSGDQVTMVADTGGVRRLTPRECERIQGLPDDWTRWDGGGNEIADSHRYAMLGDAVPVPVVEWVARRIKAAG